MSTPDYPQFEPAAAPPAARPVPAPRPIPEPDRNTRVFVASIILGIGALLGLLLLYWMAVDPKVAALIDNLAFTLAVSGLASVYQLVVAILGIANAKRPEKAQLLVNLGISLIVLRSVSLVLSLITRTFDVLGDIIGFLLPILFLLGALEMRRQRDWLRKQAAR